MVATAIDMAMLKGTLQKVQPFFASDVRDALAEQGIKAKAYDCLDVLNFFEDELVPSLRGGYTFESEAQERQRFG